MEIKLMTTHHVRGNGKNNNSNGSSTSIARTASNVVTRTARKSYLAKFMIYALLIMVFLPFLFLNIINSTSDTNDSFRMTREVFDYKKRVPISSSFQHNPRMRKNKATKQYNLSISHDTIPAVSSKQKSLNMNERKKSSSAQQEQHSRILLERAPQRIPGYIQGERKKTYFGYVMRDLSKRVLSRHIASSDVLVVSSHAQDVISFINDKKGMDAEQSWDEEQVRKYFNYTVGESFLLSAAKQQHQIHGLTVEDVTTSNNSHNNEIILDQWWKTNKPGWILLAVFDLPRGTEDSTISSAVQFWSEATVTYTVLRVHASVTTTIGDSPQFGGLRAVQTLLQHGYKVQLLSSSHQISNNNNFRPNMLITSENVETFFHTGAKVAMGETFLAYVFATQGLDLAIPSRRDYIFKEGIRRSFEMINMKDEVPYIKCPPRMFDIKFRDESNPLKPMFKTVGENSHDYHGLIISSVNDIVNKSLWSSRSTIDASEAACIRADIVLKDMNVTRNQVACQTRIIPKGLDTKKASSSTASKTEAKKKSNLLVIMIDPISRARFDQALPKTKNKLKSLNFVSFDNYTAVGDNSGPNQAALYSGLPLSGRKSIASHGQSGTKWLWDELRDAGYSTFKAEDGCIKNSNMIQSIKPNTTHGDDLHRMLCYDFVRPNCLGATPAAQHLSRYATQFIKVYNQKKPWAAFVHFIDSHEDTGMLAGTIDGIICELVSHVLHDNTAIAVISDHGLHYGPYFQSARGQLERIEPILYFKPPSSRSANALRENSDKFTTPFDLHTTLLDVTIGLNPQKSLGSSLLSPLGPNRESCDRIEEIPNRYCGLISQRGTKLNSSNEMPFPPSILSYYADIPQGNKPRRRQCSNEHAWPKTYGRFEQRCNCTTSHRDWFPCTKHPWANRALHSNEHFCMIDCPNNDLHYETRIIGEEKVTKRFTLSGSSKNTQHTRSIPSILFIEVDSVSIAYSDRHFPKTREILYRHRLRQVNGGYTCQSGLCAADFSRFSITGPHSISNQVSTLSGCISFPRGENCNKTLKDEGAICTDKNAPQYGLKMNKYHGRYHDSHWCMPDIDVTNRTKSSFLYDVAKTTGHVTLFSEEFCWPGSPYVVQDNILQLGEVDVAPHKVFCRLAERAALLQNLNLGKRELWKAENPQEPCIDGFSGNEKAQISFEHILQTWDAYSDIPKFAFLNAIAAHDYDADWSKVTLSAEFYDDYLSSFLETMLSRKDASNTVIILRSDHGLQYGPLVVDYSTQIEHVRPWTQLIVPEDLDGLSLESLFANQDRLASGADLYRTLRALMTTATSGTTEPTKFLPSVPDWSYNLLTTTIPESRSCQDGRIPLRWCRIKELEPRFGVCNPFGTTQTSICEVEGATAS